jgi:phosphocarrier protein
VLFRSKGSEIILKIEGPDEELMNETLVALINDYFGEGE